jgi:hypothetical protein
MNRKIDQNLLQLMARGKARKKLHSLLSDRKEAWNLSDEQINRAIKLIFADKTGTQVKESILYLFLYAKEILSNESSVTRRDKFKRITCGKDPTLKDAHQRLIKCIEEEESNNDFSSESQNLFFLFVKSHPEWMPEKSFVVFRDFPSLSSKPHAYIERFQLSGLCYMHAPVVLQHYLVAMNSRDAIPMLDMAAYMRQFMPADDLEEHIWKGKGGDSKLFLRSILESGLSTRFTSCSAEADLSLLMNQYGPALVQGFIVDSLFDSNSWQHIGDQLVGYEGRHAMLLIGFRKENGCLRYLLQNWWSKSHSWRLTRRI